MLRGIQTPGKLKQRTERLHALADLAAVHATLEKRSSAATPNDSRRRVRRRPPPALLGGEEERRPWPPHLLLSRIASTGSSGSWTNCVGICGSCARRLAMNGFLPSGERLSVGQLPACGGSRASLHQTSSP